jgi:hypothetical protein
VIRLAIMPIVTAIHGIEGAAVAPAVAGPT